MAIEVSQIRLDSQLMQSRTPPSAAQCELMNAVWDRLAALGNLYVLQLSHQPLVKYQFVEARKNCVRVRYVVGDSRVLCRRSIDELFPIIVVIVRRAALL
ncbi:hypothetical protein Tcan_07747 [Toxocara canis]|uniref:Uncharacterized protein n=1 Tax=Toxocara canis TaxID=6265 RepID=A0A0B2UPK7_TOXCA|nr:hypothetical protein Tcan_07747 [Toxocara canis]